MKSERRHDLETNELAVRLRTWIDNAKPYLNQLVGGAAIIAALILAWRVWGSSASVTEQQAWDKFLLASYSSDPEMLEMKRLAEDSEYSSTTVPEWAYLMWSDRQLLIASQSYLVDRTASISRLKQIQGVYEGLVSGSSVPQIRERARYGLAQVFELQDKLDAAEERYTKVSGDLAPLATARAERLKIEEVKESCNWLSSAELPKPKAKSSNTEGVGSRPSFEAEVPRSPNSPTDIQDARTLEEILTGSAGSGSGEDRYQETPTEGSDDTSDDTPSAESPASQSDNSPEKTSEGP